MLYCLRYSSAILVTSDLEILADIDAKDNLGVLAVCGSAILLLISSSWLLNFFFGLGGGKEVVFAGRQPFKPSALYLES